MPELPSFDVHCLSSHPLILCSISSAKKRKINSNLILLVDGIYIHITMLIFRLISLVMVLFFCNHEIIHALQCNIQGTCVDSNVIGYYESPDIADCKTYCTDVSECTWYLYDQDAERCILYSECSKIEVKSKFIRCYHCALNQKECDIDPSLQCNLRHSVLKSEKSSILRSPTVCFKVFEKKF